MIVITASELRSNQKDIFDKVANNDEQVIVRRGKESILITKISESDRISINPKLIAKVQKGIEDIKKGDYITVTSGKDLRLI